MDEVSAYGVIDPLSPVDPDGVVAIGGMVEKPTAADAPSDLIIIGRYVLTPDVFDEIERLPPGRGGEIQLTDALRAQASRSPFHGVLSDIDRYDTGNPLGYLKAAVSIDAARRRLRRRARRRSSRGLPELGALPTPRRLGALEAAGLVEHQPVLVDVELAVAEPSVERRRAATISARALVAHVGTDLGGERLDVDRRPPAISAASPTPRASRRIGTVAANGVHDRSMSAQPSSSRPVRRR